MCEDSGDYEPFIRRAVIETRKRIEDEDPYAKIGDESRGRALNVLSYALNFPHIWSETFLLFLVMIPKMEMAGHRDDWVPFIKKGIAISQETKDRPGEAELASQLGYLYYRLSQFELAYSWLDLSRRIFDNLENPFSCSIVLNRLALVEMRSNRNRQAVHLAEQALEKLDPHDPERANSFYVLGENARAKHNLAVAERYLRKSLKIWQLQGKKREIARGLRNLGPALFELERHDQAIDCFEESIALFGEIHDPLNQAIAQMNLGICYSLLKQPRAALSLFSMAEKIFRDVHDNYNLAKVYTNIGIAHRSLAEYKESAAMYDAGIKLWLQLGNIRSLCNALDGLGLTQIAQKEYGTAIETFRSALDYSTRLEDESIRDYVSAMLAEHIRQAQSGQERP